MRDRLRELQDKRQAARREPNSTNTWTTADDREFAEIRDKIIKNPPNRQGNPAIAETAIVRITLATNAEPGERDLRLETPAGLFEPAHFPRRATAGIFPAGGKGRQPGPGFASWKDWAKYPPPTRRPRRASRCRPSSMGRSCPAAWIGTGFKRAKGQRLVVAVSARELIPYLADAVPGWFQVAVSLHDAQGRN